MEKARPELPGPAIPKPKALRETFTRTGRIATVEVHDRNHGWCVPDVADINLMVKTNPVPRPGQKP